VQQTAIKKLQVIPGIGPHMAHELMALGYTDVASLKGQDPEAMYRRLMDLRSGPVDRCVLYVFRCAVYYASHQQHEPELLRWWNWKDRGDVAE
jgi:hypothetical protein